MPTPKIAQRAEPAARDHAAGRPPGHDPRVVGRLGAALHAAPGRPAAIPMHRHPPRRPRAAGPRARRSAAPRPPARPGRGTARTAGTLRRQGSAPSPFAVTSEVFEAAIDNPEPHADAHEPAGEASSAGTPSNAPIPSPTAAHARDRADQERSGACRAAVHWGLSRSGSISLLRRRPGARLAPSAIYPPAGAGGVTAGKVRRPTVETTTVQGGYCPGDRPEPRPDPQSGGGSGAAKDSEKSDFVTTL